MARTPEVIPARPAEPANAPELLSAFAKSQREQAIQACGKFTHKIPEERTVLAY